MRVDLEAAPAYELILSLAAAADEGGQHTLDLYPGWLDSIQSAQPRLLRAVRDFAPSDMPWAHLLTVAYDTPPPRDIPRLLEHLAAADPVELRLRLLGFYLRHFRHHTAPAVIERAARGDRAAQREFLRTSHPDDAAWQASLESLLPLDAHETSERLLGIVRAWSADVFPALQAQAWPVIERDAERVRAVLRDQGGEAALAAALPGFDAIPEPGIKRLALIPSYVIRPQITTLEHHDLRLYAYPVADASLAATTGAPSPRLIRLLKALGDERRLRILKLLTVESYTLQELADHFEVSSTTMIHHMIILRSAGLVRIKSDRGKRYSLACGALPEVSALLEGYLSNEF